MSKPVAALLIVSVLGAVALFVAAEERPADVPPVELTEEEGRAYRRYLMGSSCAGPDVASRCRPMLMRDAWGRAWREGGWSGVDEADRELQMDERYAHYLLRFEATAVGEPQSRAGWIAHGAGVSAGVRAASSQRPKVSADVEDVLRGAAGP